MWNAFSKFLGLSADSDEDVDPDTLKSANILEDCYSEEHAEEKEFDGIVTSLHTAYGLINNEVFFNESCVPGGCLPAVGTRVHVTAVRKGAVGGWRAKQVYTNHVGDFVDGNEDDTGNNAIYAPNTVDDKQSKTAAFVQHTKDYTEQYLHQLLTDKQGIRIIGSGDFGKVVLGCHVSTTITISNEGTDSQMLLSCSFLNQVANTVSQFEVGTVQLDSVNLEHASCKAQQLLPVTIEPGKSASLLVYCSARFLGSENWILVFKFEGFEIGREITALVMDESVADLEPTQPYQRTKTYDRYRMTQQTSVSSWIVPGQRPASSRGGVRLPNKLPQFQVPEKLRREVAGRADVVLICPVLMKALTVQNYVLRFSTLLHLEEIQQDIEIHEYDLSNVTLRKVGEYLGLKVPGLAEGRPSVLIGDSIILSDSNCAQYAASYQGYIHEVLKDEILLKFSNDFHMDYVDQPYNVQFTYNRNTLRRCHMAVELAVRLPRQVTFPTELIVMPSQSLVDCSQVADVAKASSVPVAMNRCPLGNRSLTTTKTYKKMKFFDSKLNERQQAAVTRICAGQSRPTPYVVFGPPGTGKTVTVVEAILQIFHNLPSSRILACTPSNSAADLLTERLYKFINLKDLIRVNAFRRSDEGIPDCVRRYCFDGNDLQAAASKRVVVCTCTTSGMFYELGLQPNHFTHCFVDEAGQATEPECLIPVGLVAAGGGQIVLAGDPMQLGPVLRSNLSKQYGLQVSFLERLMSLPLYQRDEKKFANHGCYDPLLVTKLVENYRSHPSLIQLSSKMFYDDELSACADKTLVECLCPWDQLPSRNFPILFHGVKGEDLREGNSPSWFNAMEAVQVMKYLQSIVNNEFYKLTFDDIGIITPYRKQVEKIRLLIDRLGMDRVKVGSVEEFQGQERLAMIISTVRSQKSLINVDLRYTLGFLCNPKRFNVAITRAHALLVVVGNPHVLAQDYYWLPLIKYCVRNGAYIGCDLPSICLMEDFSTVGTDHLSVVNTAQSTQQTVGNLDNVGQIPDAEANATSLTDQNVSACGSQMATAAPASANHVLADDLRDGCQETNDSIDDSRTSVNDCAVECTSTKFPESDSCQRQLDALNGLNDAQCSDFAGNGLADEREACNRAATVDDSLHQTVADVNDNGAVFVATNIACKAAVTVSNHRQSVTIDILASLPVGSSCEDSCDIDSSSSRDQHQQLSKSRSKDEELTQSNDSSSFINNTLPVGDRKDFGRDGNGGPTFDCNDRAVDHNRTDACASKSSRTLKCEQTATARNNTISGTRAQFDLVPSPVFEAQPLPAANELSMRLLEKIRNSLISSKQASTGDARLLESNTRAKSRVNNKVECGSGSGVASTRTVSCENVEQNDGSSNDVATSSAVNTVVGDDGSGVLSTSASVATVDKKIVRQMEYYFGDLNMLKDKFLLDYMSKDPDGWIPLNVFLTFNRIKQLTSDVQVLVAALKQSTAQLIELSADEQNVRRSPLKPLVTDVAAWKNDLMNRSAVVQRYPYSETLDRMQEFFEQYGSVAHIERRIATHGHARVNARTEYVDLIIYHKPDSLRNLLKFRLTTLKRMGIWVNYGNQFVEDCIGYFLAKKVECIPLSDLEPVKFSRGQDRRAERASGFDRQTNDGSMVDRQRLQMLLTRQQQQQPKQVGVNVCAASSRDGNIDVDQLLASVDRMKFYSKPKSSYYGNIPLQDPVADESWDDDEQATVEMVDTINIEPLPDLPDVDAPQSCDSFSFAERTENTHNVEHVNEPFSGQKLECEINQPTADVSTGQTQQELSVEDEVDLEKSSFDQQQVEQEPMLTNAVIEGELVESSQQPQKLVGDYVIEQTDDDNYDNDDDIIFECIVDQELDSDNSEADS